MEWRRRANQQHRRQLWGKVSDEVPGEENVQNTTESRAIGTPEEDSKSIRDDKLHRKKFCLRAKKIWGGGGGELSEFSESRKISWNQLQEIIWRGFPGGSVVKKKNAQCRRHSCPRSRKIPHAVEQLNSHAATTEACNKRSRCNEKPAHRKEE